MKFVALLTLLVMEAEARTYNVLSIDGGGIRGILPAQVLTKME